MMCGYLFGMWVEVGVRWYEEVDCGLKRGSGRVDADVLKSAQSANRLPERERRYCVVDVRA